MAARSLRREQSQLLRHLLGPARPEAELAGRLSRRPQAVASSLRILEREGLVERIGERGYAAPNSPARWWRLTENGRSLAATEPRFVKQVNGEPREVVDAEDDGSCAMRLAPYQSFVATTLKSEQIPSLLEVLADGEEAVEASFVARLDGEAHSYLFVFDAAVGARPAEMLSATLASAELPFTAGVVADVRSFSALLDDSRAARLSAARVRRGRNSGTD